MNTSATHVPNRIARVQPMIPDANDRNRQRQDPLLERISRLSSTLQVESKICFALHSLPERLKSDTSPTPTSGQRTRSARLKDHSIRMGSLVHHDLKWRLDVLL